MTDHQWTDDDKIQLRDLWAAGHSASEVGRRMKLSKNSIIGMVRRQGLPHRPSPIPVPGAERAPRKQAASRAGAVTLAPLAIVQRITNGSVKHTLGVVQDVDAARPMMTTVFKPRPAQACCFPMWTGRVPRPAPYCEAVTDGHRYCDAHRVVCFTRIVRADEARDAA